VSLGAWRRQIARSGLLSSGKRRDDGGQQTYRAQWQRRIDGWTDRAAHNMRLPTAVCFTRITFGDFGNPGDVERSLA
jgi:hypothetical protein